jgi:hypothetical protein
VGVPAGLAAIGKAYGQDLGTLVSNARTGKRMSVGAAMPHHMLALIRGIAGQTAQDFEHPLRHPGYTLLDLAARGLNAEGSATRFAAAEHAANEAATPLAKPPAAVPKQPMLSPISSKVVSPSTAAAVKSLMRPSDRTPRQRIMRDAAYTSRDAIQANRAPIPPVQTRAAQAQLPRAQGGGQVQPPTGASALARLLAGQKRARHDGSLSVNRAGQPPTGDRSSSRAHRNHQRMATTVKERYLRLMELVSLGYGWADACLLADAPVSLSCILKTVSPAANTAVAV